MESRGVLNALIPEVKRGSLDQLSEWSAEADKIINF